MSKEMSIDIKTDAGGDISLMFGEDGSVVLWRYYPDGDLWSGACLNFFEARALSGALRVMADIAADREISRDRE